MKIQTLAPEVVEQIAAGEVVERPAHLIKELVENSMDAGATEIEIDFSDGGRKVRVSDNGGGISPGDLPLTTARHATSKISRFSDLWALQTYGFRGEALSSIAAISEMTILSRTSGAETAYRLQSLYGKPGEIEPVGGAAGTTVMVENVFQNVPARLKFLKSNGAEAGHIKHTLKALALSHPEISFRIKADAELLSYWPSVPDLVSRSKQVLEQSEMYFAEGARGSMSVRAAFAPPKIVHRNNRNIWLFVQGRWVQDRTILAAVSDAYRNLLMHGEYPFAVIWLECDPQSVDVNVHPTKSQVRFVDSSEVFRVVHHTLRAALERAPWVSTVLQSKEEHQTPSIEWARSAPALENLTFKDDSFRQMQYVKRVLHEPVQTYEPVLQTLKDSAAARVSQGWGRLAVIGQAHLTYILAQSEKGLVVIDQHAAHERVMFERLMEAWRSDRPPEGQNHLLPLVLTLEPDLADALLTRQTELAKLSILFERRGPDKISLMTSPAGIKESGLVESLQKLAREIQDCGGSFAVEKYIGEICASMACHSAIRAGQAQSHEEMRSLLAQMDEYPLSSFCPHGRPVYVEYPLSELERDFGRIV